MCPAVVLRDYVHVLHRQKKKKKGAASSDSIDTLTRGRSSKQDVYFLHKGPKTLLLPAVAVQLRLKAAATKLSERGLLSRTHPVRISAQINTFHCGSHAKRTQRKTLEKIDKKLWVTSLRAAITQKLQMATHGFLGMVGRCFWLRNSWTQSHRDQTTDWWENDVQKFIRTGMRIHVCKNIEGLRTGPGPFRGKWKRKKGGTQRGSGLAVRCLPQPGLEATWMLPE